jgi:hypothetical protein
MNVIGEFVDREQVELQVLGHLQNWLVYYLARVEEVKGFDPRTLATPKSWRVTDEFSRRPENALPYVDVISVGTDRGRQPQIDGDGVVTAWWAIAVGAAVVANQEQAAKNLAGYYGTAIRLAIGQMPDLGDWANGALWTGEAFDDWSIAGERTIATVREVFTVEVSGAFNLFSGPSYPSDSPPADPYAPDPGSPDVTEKFIDVERKA